MPRLYVLSGPDLGRSFAVRAGSVIGRANDCAVVLHDASISRKHAHLEESGGTWSVIDDGSRNGLWSAGERRPKIELADLGEFKLGEVLVRFRIVDEAELDADSELQGAELEVDRAAPRAQAPPPRIPTPPAPRAPEPGDLDEIVLEEHPEPAPRASPPPPRTLAPRALAPNAPTSITARAASKSTPTPAAAPSPSAAALDPRQNRVLQYSQVPRSSGFFSSDLEQRPVWVRLLVFVVALALCAAAGYFAFSATSFLKQRAHSEPAPEVETAPDAK